MLMSAPFFRAHRIAVHRTWWHRMVLWPARNPVCPDCAGVLEPPGKQDMDPWWDCAKCQKCWRF